MESPIIGEVTFRLILVVVALTLIVLFASLYIINIISGNPYTATYFTLASLFDFAPISGTEYLESMISPYSQQFYLLLLISILDGVSKAVLIGFIIAAFIEALMRIDISARIGSITMKHMKNHVVVCGYSQLAEAICGELQKHKIEFVIVEKSQEKTDLLSDLGYKVVLGDFTKEETLKMANAGSARAIVFASDDEHVNLFGIVTAHHLYPKLRIISRAKEEPTIPKMHRGGAELAVIPEVLAALEMSNNIVKTVSI